MWARTLDRPSGRSPVRRCGRRWLDRSERPRERGSPRERVEAPRRRRVVAVREREQIAQDGGRGRDGARWEGAAVGLGRGHPERLVASGGQVAPAEGPVLGDVPADVGELHGPAEVGRRLERTVVPETEDVAHHEPHHPGRPVAVAQQVFVRSEPVTFGVHRHPREQLVEVEAGNAALSHHLPKGAGHRRQRSFTVDEVELGAQAGQRRGSLDGRHLVDGVVHAPQVGVDDGGLVADRWGEQARGEVEALRVAGHDRPTFGHDGRVPWLRAHRPDLSPPPRSRKRSFRSAPGRAMDPP